MADKSHNTRIKKLPEKSSEKKLKLTTSYIDPVELVAIGCWNKKIYKIWRSETGAWKGDPNTYCKLGSS